LQILKPQLTPELTEHVKGAEGEKPSIADLEKEIAKRDRWIDQRDRRIDKLEQENEWLRREIEKLQQAAKRQAAPFSRREPKRNPKQRGRKASERYGRDERIVPTAADRPNCGGAGTAALPGLPEGDEAGSS